MHSGLPWGIRPFESIKVHHLNSIYVETDEFKYTNQIAWKVQYYCRLSVLTHLQPVQGIQITKHRWKSKASKKESRPVKSGK